MNKSIETKENYTFNLSNNSFLVKISTIFCLLSSLSPDQIGEPNFKAKAIKSISLTNSSNSSLENSFARDLADSILLKIAQGLKPRTLVRNFQSRKLACQSEERKTTALASG